MSPLETLKKYWGYTAFRSPQQDIIQAVLDGKDVLALLPTGGGKSICFQIPTLMRPGLCIVVSPLIALMKDQIDQLKKKGIAAAAVFSGMQAREIDLVLDNCIYGHTKFLYVSPERLKTELLHERVKKMQVNLLAVDEAHCISQWGYDFRPSYLEIAAFRALLPNVNAIALTATATPTVAQDIQDQLRFSYATRFQKSFARENLAYVVRKTEDKERQLLKILRHIPGTAIIYVNTRKKTKTIVQLLQENSINATAYHAGLTTLEREARQDAWINGTTKIIVATNAFGMGIDKPNVRSVIHLDLPTTLEAYYQEAGRAGRDRQKAYAVMLYDEQDIALLLESIPIAYPSPEQLKKVYQHLANYYQVAVGSHSMTTYDFDLENFARTYGLKPKTVYQVIKTLEREGLIQLNEIFFQSAQLYIPTYPKDLYTFQVAHAPYDLLIKALLRLYGGELFSTFRTISVQHIATFLNITSQEVDKNLQALDHLALVQYCPQKSSAQITFITPRHPMNFLPLASKKLKQRAAIAQKKAEKVIYYAKHARRCRAQMLLEYFGEVAYQECGRCDICLTKHISANHLGTDDYQKYRHQVLQCLQAGMQELSPIVDRIEPAAHESVVATIRQMLENGELAYDSALRLIQPRPLQPTEKH